jgi:8-oxo-dGTP pyrophosphatase MutT (NUDIX family)
MIKPWKTVSSRPIANHRIFSIRSDVKVSPRTGAEHDFFVIECTHWVNVVAITRENKLVMVEQFRHGSDTVELEIPGGMIDASDKSPLEGGLRELREETGYEGTDARIIGDVFPNPAIMNNVCHTVMVKDCEIKHPLKWDQGEDMATRLVEISEIPSLIASGKIKHSLVVVALYYFELWGRSGRGE